MDKPLTRIGEAIEELRRAFGELVTDVEIGLETAKNLRRDIAEGLEREQKLRDLLRDRGLASYGEDSPERSSNHVSDDPENR
jgi:hypothetical protein